MAFRTENGKKKKEGKRTRSIDLMGLQCKFQPIRLFNRGSSVHEVERPAGEGGMDKKKKKERTTHNRYTHANGNDYDG